MLFLLLNSLEVIVFIHEAFVITSNFGWIFSYSDFIDDTFITVNL